MQICLLLVQEYLDYNFLKMFLNGILWINPLHIGIIVDVKSALA